MAANGAKCKKINVQMRKKLKSEVQVLGISELALKEKAQTKQWQHKLEPNAAKKTNADVE